MGQQRTRASVLRKRRDNNIENKFETSKLQTSKRATKSLRISRQKNPKLREGFDCVWVCVCVNTLLDMKEYMGYFARWHCN